METEMKKEAPSQQQKNRTPDQTQSQGERLQNPQPVFEPEQSMSEIGNDEIAQRAYAIYEQRGRFPGAELDDWLQAERELRNKEKAA
jgi:hypothetical protein